MEVVLHAPLAASSECIQADLEDGCLKTLKTAIVMLEACAENAETT